MRKHSATLRHRIVRKVLVYAMRIGSRIGVMFRLAVYDLLATPVETQKCKSRYTREHNHTTDSPACYSTHVCIAGRRLTCWLTCC